MSTPDRAHHRSRIIRLVAVLAAAILVFAACGNDDDDTDAGDTRTEDGTGTDDTTDDTTDDDGDDDTTPAPAGDADVTVTAEDIDFPTTEFSASAGEITIEYVNEGAIRHTLAIEGVDDWDVLTVSNTGDTDSGTIDLEAGEYTLFCDVPGHRGAGMEGTLTVS